MDNALCEKNRGNTGENIGKDRGKYGESSIQSVFPGYDMVRSIISAHFQDLGGEICINVMKFFISHVETYER